MKDLLPQIRRQIVDDPAMQANIRCAFRERISSAEAAGFRIQFYIEEELPLWLLLLMPIFACMGIVHNSYRFRSLQFRWARYPIFVAASNQAMASASGTLFTLFDDGWLIETSRTLEYWPKTRRFISSKRKLLKTISTSDLSHLAQLHQENVQAFLLQGKRLLAEPGLEMFNHFVARRFPLAEFISAFIINWGLLVFGLFAVFK